ncbi:MAG: hypothetical protein WBM44_18450 [Waterburya sp.]
MTEGNPLGLPSASRQHLNGVSQLDLVLHPDSATRELIDNINLIINNIFWSVKTTSYRRSH